MKSSKKIWFLFTASLFLAACTNEPIAEDEPLEVTKKEPLKDEDVTMPDIDWSALDKKEKISEEDKVFNDFLNESQNLVSSTYFKNLSVETNGDLGFELSSLDSYENMLEKFTFPNGMSINNNRIEKDNDIVDINRLGRTVFVKNENDDKVKQVYMQNLYHNNDLFEGYLKTVISAIAEKESDKVKETLLAMTSHMLYEIYGIDLPEDYEVDESMSILKPNKLETVGIVSGYALKHKTINNIDSFVFYKSIKK